MRRSVTARGAASAEQTFPTHARTHTRTHSYQLGLRWNRPSSKANTYTIAKSCYTVISGVIQPKKILIQHLINHFCVNSSTCVCFVLILFSSVTFLSPVEEYWAQFISLKKQSGSGHFSGKTKRRLHHLNIKMGRVPPSAPHLLRLAHPWAICQANSVSYESGVDISPPGKTDDTSLHLCIIAEACPSNYSRGRRTSVNPAGQSRKEESIGSEF